MNEPMSLGRWMKRLRADLDLTQDALAETVGCAPQTIRTFESGKRRPSRELAQRLADVLHVPPEQWADFARLARTPAGKTPAAPTTIDERRPPGDVAGATSRLPASGQPTIQDMAAALPPVLATKLYVPQPRLALVPRPRLRVRLDRALTGPLTVVAAPAGFGKTTLLADWLASSTQTGQVAWLSLDAADSDPLQFLRYVVAALQTVAPEVGRATLALLHAAPAPPIATLLPMLVNELAALPEPSVLMLDDYHVIDAPAVHEALAFLLDHLPPQLHLVIATRADPPLPLARLRARRQLTELREHELRFTLEEAAQFLQEVMELPLSVADIATLEARTEGWIAGLQLAALSLQDRPHEQIARFIDTFAGSHRFVVDYLVDEVLTRQPPHIQTFLLQTSILERLTGPLCDAVALGETVAMTDIAAPGQAAYSQMLLAELERANLFIVPLDNNRRWYRYHHLFAQVLRERLLSGASRETVLTLNRRAVAWLEQQGLLDEAVRQAFAVADHERAAELIERHGMTLFERREHVLMCRWVDQMPQALIETRPRLAIVAGWILGTMSHYERLEQLLNTVMRAISPADVPVEVLGELWVLRARCARALSQDAAALEFAHEAVRLYPVDVPAKRARAVLTLGVCLLHRADIDGAEAAFNEAATLAQAAGNSVTALEAATWLAELYGRQARLQDRLRVCQHAIRVSGAASGAPPALLGVVRILLGGDWYERNELERAHVAITEGLDPLKGSIDHYIVGSGYVILAQIHQAHGAGDVALATLDEAAVWAARMQIESRWFPALLGAYRARIWLQQGNLAAALQWSITCGIDDELQLAGARLINVRPFALIRVRLAKYRAMPDPRGLDELAGLIAHELAMAKEQTWVRLRIELTLLQALVMQAQSHRERALRALEAAFMLAAPEGYVRLFVDEGAPMAVLLHAAHGAGVMPEYVVMLLAAFPPSEAQPIRTNVVTPLLIAAPPPPLHLRNAPEVLTEREMEVLGLLAAGRSNQGIAEELIVAIGTVKRHVNSVMGKLGVQSRLEAVVRARELGLV